MSGIAGGTAPQTSSVRCVLWHAAEGELPGDLLTSLSKRVGRMIVCTDPYAALAEACLIERERRDSDGAISGVLLMVNPRALAEAPALIEAAKMYAPGIARWCYDRSANPRLRAVVESDVAAWHPKPQVVVTPAARRTQDAGRAATAARQPAAPTPAPRPIRAQSPAPTYSGSSTIAGPHIASPKLRLTGTENGSGFAQDSGASAPARPRPMPLLTEQELSMLLSDEPLPEDSNGAHNAPPPSPARPSASVPRPDPRPRSAG